MNTTWGCHVWWACQLQLAGYLVICYFQLRGREDHLTIFPFQNPLTIKSSSIHLDTVYYNGETKAAFCQCSSSYYDSHYIIRVKTVIYAKEKWVNFECAIDTYVRTHHASLIIVFSIFPQSHKEQSFRTSKAVYIVSKL